MAKSTAHIKAMFALKERSPTAYAALVMVALFVAWVLWSFTKFDLSSIMVSESQFTLTSDSVSRLGCPVDVQGVNSRQDTAEETFYDDTKLGYSMDSRLKNWDEKRSEWLKHHPTFATGVDDRILLLTGSQPSPCHNPTGDHFLLRLFKNKVDYTRLHGYDIFYNSAFLHPRMGSYWAKAPLIRAAMLAHPEAEWIWWVDSDAVFTDMDFKLPLEKYKNHNLVVDGWPSMIYESRSWYGLNAGVLLFRNCQWSIDFMEVWTSMGPQTPNYEKWGQILKSTFTDKTHPISDDQSALVYLLLKQKDRWGNKVYIENEYCFQCYWASVANGFDNVTEKYVGIEKNASRLRRRHAEVVSESYGSLMDQHLKEAGYGKESGKRPFITHFTGCQPCSGDYNPIYVGDSCREGMERALNFADNQVLRNYGFVHPDLLNSSFVLPLPFDSPGMYRNTSP